MATPSLFLVECVPIFIFNTMCLNTGQSIGSLVSRQFPETGTNALFVVIGLVTLVLCFIVYRMTSMFLNTSVYVPRSIWGTTNARQYVAMRLVPGILFGVYDILYYFPLWVPMALFAVHAAFSIWWAFGIWRLPLLSNVATSIELGFLWAVVLEDVVGIVCCSGWVTVQWWQVVVINVIGLVVAMSTAPWLVRWRVGKLTRLLAYDMTGNRRVTDCEKWIDLDPEEADQRLESLGLDDENTAMTLINVGYGNGCDLAVDFSLIHFVMSRKVSIEMLMFCTRWLVCFPCENVRMGSALKCLRLYRSPSLDARFFLFQVEQVRVIRQSSNVAALNETVTMAWELSRNAQAVVTEAWAQEVVYYPRFKNIANVVTGATSRCGEVANTFPASLQHAQAHMRVLIEAATDFRGGVLARERLDNIEAGRIDLDDTCYRAFVARYPFYLKDHILGLKGEALWDRCMFGDGNTSADAAAAVSSAAVDAVVEEKIAKRLFNHARSRLAMQTCLAGQTMETSRQWVVFRLFAVVFSIAVAVALNVGLSGRYNNYPPRFERQGALSVARQELGLSWLMLILDQSDATGRLRFDVINEIVADFDEVDPVIPFVSSEYGDNSQFSAFRSLAAMSDFFEIMGEFARNGEDTRAIAPSLFEPEIVYRPCSGGKPLSERRTTVPALFSEVFQGLIMLREREIGQWWSHAPWAEVPDVHEATNQFCTIANAWSAFSDGVAVLREAMSDGLEADGAVQEVSNVAILIAVPITFAALLFVPFAISARRVLQELQRIAFLISKTPKAAKAQCSAPMMIGSDGVDCVHLPGDGSAPRHDATMTAVLVAVCVIFIGEVVLVVVVLVSLRETGRKLRGINGQLERVHQIMPESVELVRTAVTLLLLQDMSTGTLVTSSQKGRPYGAPNATLATSTEIELNRVAGRLSSTAAHLEDLASDLNGFDSIFGIDELAGDLLRGSPCDPEYPDRANVHGTYRCASLMVSLWARNEMIHEIVASLDSYTGDVADSLSTNLLHQLSYHLLPALSALGVRLDSTLPDELVNTFQARSLALMLAGVGLALVAQIALELWTREAKQVFEGMMMVIRRLSPQALCAYQPLIDLLLHRESLDMGMTMAHYVVHNSSDPLLVVNRQGVIQMLSASSVQGMFGYSVEQVLGQHVSLLFGARFKILAKPAFERVDCVNAAGEHFPASVAMFEVVAGSRAERRDVLVIIRDVVRTDELKRDAELIRGTTDNLMMQIIPKSMLDRRDPVVTIGSASFGFVDVVEFSDWASSMSPQDVMTVLSELFSGYDAALSTLSGLTRLMTVGDGYLVGGGMFETSSSHAVQTLQFCVTAIFDVLTDLNLKFPFSPSAACAGVQSGGPVLCAVMGGERPSFDVFGAAVVTAVKLQETCPPGKIALSGETHALVDGRMTALVFEPRGEIFLESIGMHQAWTAAPRVAAFASIAARVSQRSST